MPYVPLLLGTVGLIAMGFKDLTDCIRDLNSKPAKEVNLN
jgi:hypothetical protein